MATLGGQTSKEMHCEHRNSKALSSKKEGGSVGSFPTVGAGASPYTQARPWAAVRQAQPGPSSPWGCAPRKEEKWEFVGNGR